MDASIGGSLRAFASAVDEEQVFPALYSASHCVIQSLAPL